MELLGGVGTGLERVVVDFEEGGDDAGEGAGGEVGVGIEQVDSAGTRFAGADGVVENAFEQLAHFDGFGVGEDGADVLNKSKGGFFFL